MTSTKKSTYSYEKKEADIRDIFDIETKAADRSCGEQKVMVK